ncbi:hypothetical protein LCGC14_2898110, partial [marine sediment metagenome]
VAKDDLNLLCMACDLQLVKVEKGVDE